MLKQEKGHDLHFLKLASSMAKAIQWFHKEITRLSEKASGSGLLFFDGESKATCRILCGIGCRMNCSTCRSDGGYPSPFSRSTKLIIGHRPKESASRDFAIPLL